MMCYAGIDLHATNSVVVVIDEADRVLYQKRLRNELAVILTALEPYQATVQGVVVESTYKLVLACRRVDGRGLSRAPGPCARAAAVQRAETRRRSARCAVACAPAPLRPPSHRLYLSES